MGFWYGCLQEREAERVIGKDRVRRRGGRGWWDGGSFVLDCIRPIISTLEGTGWCREGQAIVIGAQGEEVGRSYAIVTPKFRLLPACLSPPLSIPTWVVHVLIRSSTYLDWYRRYAQHFVVHSCMCMFKRWSLFVR